MRGSDCLQNQVSSCESCPDWMVDCAGGFLTPGEDSSQAASQLQGLPARALTAVQQQQDGARDGSEAPAEQDGLAEDTVWQELAEELRHIPQVPLEGTTGMAEADAGQGLLQGLRQAAGSDEADATAKERARVADMGAARGKVKNAAERRKRPGPKQHKTQAAGFDPHLMLSRLAQPVTKFTAKVVSLPARVAITLWPDNTSGCCYPHSCALVSTDRQGQYKS